MWKSPYAKYLLAVEKPGRYVGGEFGSVTSKDANATIALAFPDVYEIGMSHIGLSILYEMVNNVPNFRAERVYMPWPDMVKIIRENSLPLVSLESGTVLNDFDVVGFSLQYELTFTNVIAMLDMGQIPRYANQRTSDDALVVVGGPVAVQAEPISPFVDLVVLGDGEDALVTLLEQVEECKASKMSRQQILEVLNELPFAYAPNLYQHSNAGTSFRKVLQVTSPVARPAVINDLEAYPTGKGPVATVQAVFDRYSVEIARGCTEGCRFCQAGYLYRPVRERSKSSVAQALKKATCTLGFDEVSLSSLSSADHSGIEDIITGLGNDYLGKRVSFSVPSLRAYGLSDNVIEVLSKLRASGVTLAPEAGSQRLRDLVNKNVTEEDVLGAASRFYERGFNRIKLYFMLGLPTETDDDLCQIVDLAVKIRQLGQLKAGKRADVVVSVSTFVPKPFTPFENEQMIDEAEIVRRQQLLRQKAWHHRIKLKTHDARMSVLEGIFARGDSQLAPILAQAVDKGAMFDGWDELFNEQIWNEILNGVDKEAYLAKIPDNMRVPWDHIDSGVSVEFRRAQRDEAYQEKTTAPCGVFACDNGSSDSSLGDTSFVCHHCGIDCKRSQLSVKPSKAVVSSTTVATSFRKPKSKGHPKPAPVIQAGDQAKRYRLEVSFHGRMVFVGHLDRMRHLMRSLARAGFQLWYTQGFHPKPKIEAPPPMPLGTAALAEPFDVWLVDAPSQEEMIRQLSVSLPADMEIQSIQELSPQTPKLSLAYEAVQYIALIKESESFVEKALQHLLEIDKLEVMREKKGRIKQVEIRQFVMDALVLPHSELSLPVPDFSDRTAVSMTLALVGSGGTRPSEVLGAILPYLEDLWVVRTRWIKRK